MEVGFPRTGARVTTRSQGRNRTVKYPIFAPGDPSPRTRRWKLPSMFRVPPRHRTIHAAIMVILPGLLYFVLFCLLTYPTILQFSSAFIGDNVDGYQNIWSLWWVNKAITGLHILPLHTSYLHYPYGTSLIGDALNPFNGFLTIALFRLLQPVQAYNCIVIFSYVATGVTTFLLTYRVTGFYIGGLISGFIFTFSNYHLLHTIGHMNLISMEWIPLFILCWYVFLIKPTVRYATFSAISLLLVILCDYYYYFYCVLVAAIFVMWKIKDLRSFSFSAVRACLVPVLVFVILSAVLTGPLVVMLIMANHNDPFVGYHDATVHSLDLASLFIPNQGWRFGNLTAGYWSHLDVAENRTFIGISLTFMLLYAWVKRKSILLHGAGAWFATALFFLVMCLGPSLHIWGQRVSLPVGLPYALLTAVFPPLSVSGVPSRMIVIAILCAGIIYAAGLRRLLQWTGRKWIVVPVLITILGIEYLPSDLAFSQIGVPAYVHELANARPRGPVIDMVAGLGGALYYQTIYDSPEAFGHMSRIPGSVERKDQELRLRVLEMRDDILYKQYGFRYLVVPPSDSFPYDPVVYADATAKVYRLGSENQRVFVESPSRLLQGKSPVHEVLPHYSIGQTFTASRNYLRGVGLYLRNVSGPVVGRLVFHLQRAEGKRADLVRISVAMSTIADEYLTVFTFAPLPRSRGHKYYVYLTASEVSSGPTLEPWGSHVGSYHGGTLMINHKKASGDLVMQLFYSRQSQRAPR
jgi:hypothetical protein